MSILTGRWRLTVCVRSVSWAARTGTCYRATCTASSWPCWAKSVTCGRRCADRPSRRSVNYSSTVEKPWNRSVSVILNTVAGFQKLKLAIHLSCSLDVKCVSLKLRRISSYLKWVSDAECLRFQFKYRGMVQTLEKCELIYVESSSWEFWSSVVTMTSLVFENYAFSWKTDNIVDDIS